jgi:phosphoserine phosphatase
MHLYILRHGQSEGNVSNIVGLDPPMTEMGHRQIKLAAEYLSNKGFNHIYCSPLYRAMQTAGILRESLSIEPVVDPVFCEIWGTDWNGHTKVELQKAFPWAELPDELGDHQWWPQIAETKENIIQRAEQAIKSILDIHKGLEDRVCLVGHGMFTDAILHVLLGASYRNGVTFNLYNSSLCRMEFDINGDKVIKSINEVNHLPMEIWT